jgi:hypothetical protein
MPKAAAERAITPITALRRVMGDNPRDLCDHICRDGE